MHLFFDKKLIYDAYMNKKVTRFAPTPSGHLHFGNFCNLIFIYWFAKQNNATLKLRVDDYDYNRCKDEFLESLFLILDKLQISFDEGPSSVGELKLKYSQQLKTELYYQRLMQVQSKYVCECSRSQYKEHKFYPGTCRNKGLSYQNTPNQLIHQWRYKLSHNSLFLEDKIGDFVLWRKENIPSALWVSLCEDDEMGVTDIIRGDDLLVSSQAQSFLAINEGLNYPTLKKVIHHPLITDRGRKLSKSQNDLSILDQLSKSDGVLNLTYQLCDSFGFERLSLDELIETKFPFS